jgi:hypothetical protein
MNLNGILIGSEDPEGLVAGWQLGTGYGTVGPHDQVRGRNPQPGEDPEGWIATFADPDDNYFQLVKPFPG